MIYYLQLTEKCTNDCLFCNRPPVKDPIDLPGSTIKGKIIKLVAEGCRNLVITGGEPTLRKDLVKIIRFAKQKGIKRIELQTNGVLLSDRHVLRDLFDNGLDVIHFAFKSHKKETYDRLSGCGDDTYYQKTLSAITEAISFGKPIHLIYVITSLNHQELPDFARFVKERFPGLHSVNFSICIPVGNAWKNQWIVPKISEVSLNLYAAMAFCRKNHVHFFVSEGYPLCYLNGYEHYSAIVQLLIDKEVIIDDFIQNLQTFDVAQVTKNPEWKAEVCDRCRVYGICGGVCPAYKRIYGTEELNPSRKSPENILEKTQRHLRITEND